MSSLFGRLNNRYLIFALSAIVAGCQSFPLKSRELPPAQSPKTATVEPQAPAKSEAALSVENESPDVVTSPDLPEVLQAKKSSRPLPKFAFIFGPGGAKAFAHAGFLAELENRKVPIQIVSGVEWGAFVAGLYAYRGSSNDIQWQANKLKGDLVLKKNFISRQFEPNNLENLQPFLTEVFGGSLADRTRIPFVCPSYMISKNETYIMNKSYLRDAVSFCMPLAPLFHPYRGYMAQPMETRVLAQYLKSKGATYVVYVSVLGGPSQKGLEADTSGAALWHLANHRMLPRHGVDAMITLNLSEFSIMDFDRTRDIINKGANQSKVALDSLLRPWGL